MKEGREREKWEVVSSEKQESSQDETQFGQFKIKVNSRNEYSTSEYYKYKYTITVLEILV